MEGCTSWMGQTRRMERHMSWREHGCCCGHRCYIRHRYCIRHRCCNPKMEHKILDGIGRLEGQSWDGLIGFRRLDRCLVHHNGWTVVHKSWMVLRKSLMGPKNIHHDRRCLIVVLVLGGSVRSCAEVGGQRIDLRWFGIRC